MKYPPVPKPGEWYCEVQPHTQQTGLYQGKFNSVNIIVGIQGKNPTCDMRNVNLKVQDVEKQLTEGIDKAKKIVDLLNSGGSPVTPETGTCARCDGPCPEDDYLCRGCRS